MKKTAIALALSAFAATPALADTFVNGGFEDGTFNGWTQGSGLLTGFNTLTLNPADYMPTGSAYNASYQASAIVGPGLDPRTGGGLNMVYAGNYSARVNDSNNNNSINVLQQTVNNYTDNSIYFEWAAVLEASHGVTDSDAFNLTLVDTTKNQTLVQVSYSSASAAGAGLFNNYGGNYWTPWQVENIDLVALGVANGTSYIGDNFTLSLLATDCPYGGHWGYVYLDGFAPTLIPPGQVPEPASLALIGLGLAGLASMRRRKST